MDGRIRPHLFRRKHRAFLEREYSRSRIEELLKDRQKLQDEMLRLSREAVSLNDLQFAREHLERLLAQLKKSYP